MRGADGPRLAPLPRLVWVSCWSEPFPEIWGPGEVLPSNLNTLRGVRAAVWNEAVGGPAVTSYHSTCPFLLGKLGTRGLRCWVAEAQGVQTMVRASRPSGPAPACVSLPGQGSGHECERVTTPTSLHPLVSPVPPGQPPGQRQVLHHEMKDSAVLVSGLCPLAPGSWELVDVGHGRCEEQKLQMPQAVTKGDGCQRRLSSWPTPAAAPPFLLPTVPWEQQGAEPWLPWWGWVGKAASTEGEGGAEVGGGLSAPRFLGLWVGAQGSRGAQCRGPRSLGGAVLGGPSEDREPLALSPAHSRGFGREREGDESRRGEISRQQCGERPLSANSSRPRKAVWVDANASKCRAPEELRIPQASVAPSALQKYQQFPLLRPTAGSQGELPAPCWSSGAVGLYPRLEGKGPGHRADSTSRPPAWDSPGQCRLIRASVSPEQEPNLRRAQGAGGAVLGRERPDSAAGPPHDPTDPRQRPNAGNTAV